MSEDCPAYDRDAHMCLAHPGDCEFSPVDGEATLASEMSEVRTSDTPAPMTAAMDLALDEIDPEPDAFLDAAARETLTGVEWQSARETSGGRICPTQLVRSLAIGGR